MVDLMRRAGIDIQTVSIKETKEIRTSHGIDLLTDRTFGECDFSDADMLVIPGGMPGTKYLEEYKPLTELLTDFYQKGGKVAAICAAPGVFERLGFLKGKVKVYCDDMEGFSCCDQFIAPSGKVKVIIYSCKGCPGSHLGLLIVRNRASIPRLMPKPVISRG